VVHRAKAEGSGNPLRFGIKPEFLGEGFAGAGDVEQRILFI